MAVQSGYLLAWARGLLLLARCGLFLPPLLKTGPGPARCSRTRATDSDPQTDTAGRDVEGL